ncbi:permease-like cell division protein FtsX [Nocardioides rotundus]|uniref:permease-like cell division protein FtsX n=1 Tax=Nocardioides rotundus TaxID=1774216 RepID=UPI001CC15271|nr:permease-like cell division protein FtsX [Nocardioides rotundus]UAL29092.1 permease-like cell division protein FtsX [Nocardioides rotundus]
MQLRYVFSELGHGLRRNLSMHLAVILTLFVSLTLVGLGVLMNKQADKAADFWGSQIEIPVNLCRERDSSPNCTGEVTAAQKERIIQVIEENPEADGYEVETKREAFEKAKELIGEEKFEGDYPPLRVESMPETIRVQLKDPEKFEGITSAVTGLDGVAGINDQRDRLKPIFDSINYMQLTSLITAGFLVIAALLLVGNTVRLAAMARRREIGIMRLVGASSLYIALPFLLEALFTALVGVGLATVALAAFTHWGVNEGLANLQFMPWVGWPEWGLATAIIAVLGPLLTLIPTLVLTRKYLKV